MTPFESSRAPVTTELWKHGSIPVLGLTGGIASGKSEVARILADRGSVVIDADRTGHSLLEDEAVRGRVVDRFGPEILAGERAGLGLSPRIDRKALGRIVFADADSRSALEAILHPLMRARFLADVERHEHAGGIAPPSIVLDAAILMEAGWDELCDRVVFIDSPRSDRIERAARLRGWSRETFAAREQAQWPCEEKRRRADLVINNGAGVDALEREVDRLETLLGESPPASLTSQDSAGARAACLRSAVSVKEDSRSVVNHPEDNLA